MLVRTRRGSFILRIFIHFPYEYFHPSIHHNLSSFSTNFMSLTHHFELMGALSNKISCSSRSVHNFLHSPINQLINIQNIIFTTPAARQKNVMSFFQRVGSSDSINTYINSCFSFCSPLHRHQSKVKFQNADILLKNRT